MRKGANEPQEFVPRPGAKGYQVSNPSALDHSAVAASLEIFNEATMKELRKKSVSITAYLERLLLNPPDEPRPYSIITPSNPNDRGAQLSIRLQPGLLDSVLRELEDNGVVVDERKPDVIRVAPAPLYKTYLDVWNFVQVFNVACEKALREQNPNS